ncbi:hypothetical protein HZS_3294 [Henneguya salminicola]|nr:hypothetical protein HZS_3294 [Henneguya salminicola]
MAHNFVFNGRSYRKNLTKANCSNCCRGCPARLITRNNEISIKGEHNCEANRLVIQITVTYLTHESFVDTSSLKRHPN